jgi:hypothetical protein
MSCFVILFEKSSPARGDILRPTLCLGHLATFILFQASFAALLGEFKSGFPMGLRCDYGANHLVTATFGQAQNQLEAKIYTPLLYIGINKAIRCNDFEAI